MRAAAEAGPGRPEAEVAASVAALATAVPVLQAVLAAARRAVEWGAQPAASRPVHAGRLLPKAYQLSAETESRSRRASVAAVQVGPSAIERLPARAAAWAALVPVEWARLSWAFADALPG